MKTYKDIPELPESEFGQTYLEVEFVDGTKRLFNKALFVGEHFTLVRGDGVEKNEEYWLPMSDVFCVHGRKKSSLITDLSHLPITIPLNK